MSGCSKVTSKHASTSIDHTALMDRVRRRIGDRRLLRLVKAFLMAGVLTEDGVSRDTWTGTPQGALCAAAHKPPYEQWRVMRSAGVSGLVRAGSAIERFA